ncbi:BHLH domain-containing protein [Abeliophyllum distichum]|uniref:BHLH domain-containing protein n=1 Tax=Abeliophyllum distichum TaxID=126358 RepID=A0ABD1UQV6_9LAMI
MDSFDWNDSPVVTNASSSWSNQQHDHMVVKIPYTPNPKDGQITTDLGIASQQKTVINGTVHAASSGASASDVSKGKQEDNSHFHTNDFKETFAQTTTDQYINPRRSSSTKLYTTKRSNAHSELKEIPSKSKKPRSDKHPNSSNINFQQTVSSVSELDS